MILGVVVKKKKKSTPGCKFPGYNFTIPGTGSIPGIQVAPFIYISYNVIIDDDNDD